MDTFGDRILHDMLGDFEKCGCANVNISARGSYRKVVSESYKSNPKGTIFLLVYLAIFAIGIIGTAALFFL